MAERIFVQGNEAIGWGAISADALYFFGYPITPQNEITEFFARELPERGGVFVQAQSELGSINMLHGAAATGVRCLTSTSSPGWGLMQETMSQMARAQVPCVIVLVQRGGPGGGTTRHAQMDYLSACWGGGPGGYKNIVLAPASVQESHDLVQLAFHLADKYCNPVIVLSDAILGQMAEPLEVRRIDFGPLPEKDWALRGTAEQRDGRPRHIPDPLAFQQYVKFLEHLDERFRTMADNEVRYEAYEVDDADVVVVAYGSSARVSKEAVRRGRARGLKVGLLRPITLWPFPYEPVRQKAAEGAKFLVVEDSMGQMIQDVRLGAEGKGQVHLLGVFARHTPTDGGMIFPDRVYREIETILLS